MDIRRILGVAGVVAASGVLMAGVPAVAQETTWSVSHTADDGEGRTLTESANGQILASDEATLTIALGCTAVAPDGIATSVTQCYLEGADGTRYGDEGSPGSLPGPADARATAVIDAPRQAYKVCVSSLTFLSNTGQLFAPLVCSEQS